MWPFRKETSAVVVSEQRLLADPEPWLLELFGASPATSGVAVTPLAALSVPAVRTAVELLAGVLGTLPCKAYQPADNGGREPAPDHPVHALVHRDANDWTSAGALRSQLTIDALLQGGGFAYANRGTDKRVVEFIRLPPTAVTVEIDERTGEPVYRYRENTTEKLYSFRDVLHVRPLASLNGITGQAPVKTAREAIALCIVAEQYMAKLMASGGRPSGILSFPQKLGAEVAKRIKASWQAATSGAASGGTAVLEEGGTFTPLAFTSVDAQFAEMRAFQIVEIARAFNVPPTFLADFSRATWSNITEANRQLVTFSLMPWIRGWEAAYRRVLLTEEDRLAQISIEFVVDGLLQGNASERATAISQFRSAGVMTANEARRLENLPAMPDGDKLENPFTTSGKSASPKTEETKPDA
ncbi:phage portal protein [Neorhizobium galegae]|uniref:phage portal protein n=1 Tax=Neorhizobium galegae TaxID=399 RepID=UPI0006213D25|nr:phage portal protein [Neorhizobium galegae]MCQ1778322.1 phage portal protein [Neorhizobium galegae]MCQ1796704.1 phage portal protein [Neorhizobium galegae]CDZ27995.1 Portal protein, HK97 family [Neorhizobium galegae bv. officinalis]